MNNFASAMLGQISTPVNILKEFLEIFNRRQKCKAAILSWLDGKHFYGQEWVRITLENLGEILGYCRETISKHLRELVADKLVNELPAQRFPKDTANMYRLNPNWLPPIEFDKSEWAELSKLLGFWKHLDMLPKILFFGRCEKIDIDGPKNAPINANNPPTLETNLKLFKNNNTAVAEKKEVVEEKEPDWESIAVATDDWEQTQITHFVEGNEEISSTDEIDPHEDLLPAPEIKPTSTQNKPTKDEIRETCTELKRLRINPDPCLGVIKKYWGNVGGAIARVKESLSEGWCDNPTGLFINSCKSGIKAKTAVTSDVSAWFEWARRRGIVLAMQGGKWAYLPDGSQAGLEEMMRRYPMEGA
ncbi:helix-turn-helix domain-containing protein [Nostoc sp.]|uniref:helix-turn-helix domain-containing protein n=1 Tax=Nostoc sp. TaxID=1180 RepID=UPI002FEEB019